MNATREAEIYHSSVGDRYGCMLEYDSDTCAKQGQIFDDIASLGCGGRFLLENKESV
jgi:hypothetical protein